MQSNEKSSKNSTKPVPKWLKMKQQNKSSAGKQTAKPTVQKSSGSAQKPNEPSRDEKRKRWAKKARPQQKSVVVRKGPEFEYISACCSTPARKPRAGQKESVKDAETGKMKDKPKGLGKWRCTACGKIAKVTPQKPAPNTATPPTQLGSGNAAELSVGVGTIPREQLIQLTATAPQVTEVIVVTTEVPNATS
jgi:hypothetical protein